MPAGPPVVRPATPGDAAAIARLMRGVADEERWISTLPGTPVAELEERYARQLAEEGHHQLVVVAGDEGAGGGVAAAGDTADDDALAGFGSVRRSGDRTPHELGMALDADHRGRGLGGALLDALLAACAADPAVAKVALEAWPHNAGAIALYASRGFVVEGVLRDHYVAPDGTSRWSSVIMGWWPTGR